MNVLAFFAHPDDETILAGGLLALLADGGHPTTYLCCTRGEGGECGIPPLCRQADLGSVRELEMRNAVEALGGSELFFLDYVDPLVGEGQTLYGFTEDIMELSEKLLEFVVKRNIDVLITHGSNGEYGHPGHRLVYAAARTVVKNLGCQIHWYTVQATYPNEKKPHLTNKNDPADWILDISPVFMQKVSAARAHATQQSLFLRRKSNELGRLALLEEVIVSEESYFNANSDCGDPLKSIFQELDLLYEPNKE